MPAAFRLSTLTPVGAEIGVQPTSFMDSFFHNSAIAMFGEIESVESDHISQLLAEATKICTSAKGCARVVGVDRVIH